ncbi:MAG: glycosyltransferase [Lachnospiraceae bacterium]|nr:glycosyltransferase [Candidatus Colinaster scatohippi]
MSKKISVVTVCFNSQDTIRMTIESVLSQKYDDFEYIIVDGASTDETLKIIGEYSDNAIIRMISEADNGLYDAMNKATSIAEGDYLCFMNSGDIFADSNVLSDISDRLSGDITYGNVVRIREDGEFTEKYKGTNAETKWTLLKGRMICHQAMFIKRETMLLYGYDTRYRITADFNMLCRMVRDKKELNYVDRDIARMDNIEGISSDKKNIPVMWKEDDDSIKKCFPVWYMLLRPLKYIKRKLL